MKRGRSKPMQFSQKRFISIAIVFGLIVLECMTFLNQSQLLDNSSQVWFLDVGQGDASFVRTVSGKQILIDAGPSDEVLSKLSQLMWPWDRSIDVLFLTHPDADHITGAVELLERFEIGTIFVSGKDSSTKTYQSLMDIIEETSTQTVVVSEKDNFKFEEFAIDVLWPEKNLDLDAIEANESSIVLHLAVGDTDLLLMGDATEFTEQEMNTPSGIEVLKIGHHGSITSTSREFLEKVSPIHGVVSAGEEIGRAHV